MNFKSVANILDKIFFQTCHPSGEFSQIRAQESHDDRDRMEKPG
jgi:hypothetical protein